ncbi:MAG: hypothetical protein AAGA60_11305 [Cyanobacteria bacterium P01_E01_bin.42]
MFDLKRFRLRITRRISILLAVIFFFSVLLTGLETTASPSIDAVRQAVERSARYLVAQTREDGMFVYRINLNPRIQMRRKYNMLRHAGTIYAMSTYYQLQDDRAVRSAMERAGQYLRDESIAPISGRENLLAVWSNPDVTGSDSPRQAKLGGTGLGLVALLSLEEIQPGFTPLEDLQALGRFLVYMQKKDGSFYSKYIPSEGGRDDRWQSLFYPGEAALGLAMLYEKDASEVWLEAAAKAIAYLARSREDEIKVPADHWALLATERLLGLDREALPVSRQLLVRHAIQICKTILDSQIDFLDRPEYEGGFSANGRVTPTATRLEGLQGALSFLPPDRAIYRRIDSAVARGIAFLLRSQIDEGEFAGAFPRAIGPISSDLPNADQFNRRVTEVRIDYVQHALSAMIQYLQRGGD